MVGKGERERGYFKTEKRNRETDKAKKKKKRGRSLNVSPGGILMA